MKLNLATAVVAAAAASTVSTGTTAFVPIAPTWKNGGSTSALRSTLEESRSKEEPMSQPEPPQYKEPSEPTGSLPFLMFREEEDDDETKVLDDESENDVITNAQEPKELPPLTAEEFNGRLSAQLAKMRLKDRTSLRLEKEDLKIVYEDDHIVVLNKPSGVLTVAGREQNPSLAQAAFENIPNYLATADHMVVHRLGMDTSGVIVLAKDMDAVRGMNTVFRTRKIERHYEALVVGHVEKSEGLISLPLMRDYEYPPYMRVSTDDHQVRLIDLDHKDVGKKILEGPKKSITQYKVLSREEFAGEPVTRVALTSFSGRYHQLNVHLAAFGHPIVGDTVYGYGGEAVSNGGLTDAELESLIPNPNRADEALQKRIAVAAQNLAPCVHAKSLKFRHPVTKTDVELSSNAPF